MVKPPALAMPLSLLDAIRARLPTRSAWRLARRLLTRANAERDAARYQAAAALYDEALRLVPDAPRFHVQAGHMHKESGDLVNAERHYLAALRSLPDDPDLAIQFGHFYKVGGRIDEAEAAYARALALRPGWVEAEEELARVGGGAPENDPSPDEVGMLVPELLPKGRQPGAAALREGFQVRRLGATSARTRGAYRRVLRGIEAIRGFVVSSQPLSEIVVLLDGEAIHRAPLQPFPIGNGAQAKYVFNIWHDFSGLAPGPRQIELRAADALGRARWHRALIDIVAPLAEADFPDSDTIVGPLEDDGRSIEARIGARPSMIRPARRTLLPHPPRAILVQRADQLGDLAASIPALRRLRALFPEARLVLLGTSANADLARTLDMIDDVVVADFHEETTDGPRVMGAAAQEALRRTLADHAFDLAIDLGETSGSRPLLLLSGARFLYGFKDREFPWLSAGFDLYTHDPGNHQEMAAHPAKLMALIEGLGAIVAGPAPPLPAPPADPRVLASHGLDRGRRYAVLHTGARLAYSRWHGYAALAALLIARTDLDVIVMGDEPLAGLPPSDRIRMATGRMAFAEFDALLASAALLVGNDSGPKHLASLRGTPVVSLHMARLNWNEWGQYGTGAIVSRRVPCAGCGIGADAEDCGKDFACIRDITAEEAFEAAMAVIGAPPGRLDGAVAEHRA